MSKHEHSSNSKQKKWRANKRNDGRTSVASNSVAAQRIVSRPFTFVFAVMDEEKSSIDVYLGGVGAVVRERRGKEWIEARNREAARVSA